MSFIAIMTSEFNVFQELLVIFFAIIIVLCVILLIWILNKLRLELSHIRTITALIAENSGVMHRIQCPGCENMFWEDATNEYAVCNYCNTEFRIEDIDIITKKNQGSYIKLPKRKERIYQ